MNAIEITNLSKSFRGMYAVNKLNMTVPVGSIYGFIGENGSGKSTTQKLICGLLVPDEGEIKLFGKDYRDAGVRASVGALIESAGCFPSASVWTNLMMQALNLNLTNPAEEIDRVLGIVRMRGNEKMKFSACSLGMKQRIGIAMALLGEPKLLILDEPINGLDVDGMRIMREILLDVSQNHNITVLIASHVLGELEKIATHYGVICRGSMIKQLTAEEMNSRSTVFIKLKADDTARAVKALKRRYKNVTTDGEEITVYDEGDCEKIVEYLMSNGIAFSALNKNSVGLEQYYIQLMSQKEGENE